MYSSTDSRKSILTRVETYSVSCKVSSIVNLYLHAECRNLEILIFPFSPILVHIMDSLYTLQAPSVNIPKAFTAGWVSVILSHLRVLLEHNQRCCISLNKYGVFREVSQFFRPYLEVTAY